jgi:hypothetical protein
MLSSRYRSVSRRAFLRSSIAAAALTVVPRGIAGAATKKKTKPKARAKTTTTKPAVATTVAAAAAVAAGSATETFDVTKEMAFAFTYEASGGGRVKNPYIAIWIEDLDGKLVKTVSLWFQRGKGLRWLPDLIRWYKVDSDRISAGGVDTAETISSATRLPGSYSVVWDGSNDQGVPVGLGEYYVCIEASRERGPYQLIREKIALGAAPTKIPLPPKGELTKANLELRVRA